MFSDSIFDHSLSWPRFSPLFVLNDLSNSGIRQWQYNFRRCLRLRVKRSIIPVKSSCSLFYKNCAIIHKILVTLNLSLYFVQKRTQQVGKQQSFNLITTFSYFRFHCFAGSQTPKRKPNPVEKAKLFWPSLRPTHYSVGTGNIQVPLTFSLSGLYGKYAPGTVGTGIIGSSYGTISDLGGTAISTLVGNSYENYRTYPGLRIYGRVNGPTWSGWGNGKWGHYGKG